MVTKAKVEKAKNYFKQGINFAKQGDHRSAEQQFSKVLTIFPSHYETLNNLALTYLFQNKMVNKAELLLKRSIQNSKEYIDPYRNLTRLYLQQGRIADATGIIEKQKMVISLSAEEKKQHILLLQQLGQFHKVKDNLSQYLAEGNLGQLQNEFEFHYGNNSLRLGEYHVAIQYFTNLLAKEFNVVTLNNLAMSYLSIDEKEKAESLLRESIKKAPNNTEAYRNISMMKKFTENDEDLKSITDKMNDVTLDETQRGHLYFALGKAYDDLKEYGLAFTAYEQGNLIKRRDIEFDISEEYLKYKDMTSAFKIDNPNLSGSTKTTQTNKISSEQLFDDNDYPIPVFIVGMPRSGTSLLEQIFATIDGVAALGELTLIENLMTSRSIDQEFLYPNDVAKISQSDWQKYRKQYFDSALNLVDKSIDTSQLKFLIDKQPFNFWHIGIIRKLFPEAKIIHSRRNAMDCCLSNFFQYFYGNLSYSNDLKEIGQYYRLHEKMMDYWKTLYPDDIITLDYESLVESPQENLAPLFSFLEIPWDEKYLEFYLSKRPVRTMSVDQIRKPIYKGSVERWRHYEPWLDKLSEGLAHQF